MKERGTVYWIVKITKNPVLHNFFQLLFIFVYFNNCLLKFVRDNAQIVTTGVVNKLMLCLAPKQCTEKLLKVEKQINRLRKTD